MRPAIMIVIAALSIPAVSSAHAGGAGATAAQAVTDLSAAAKKKKPAKAKDEYLKAAPGAGPSGPKN